MIWQRPVSHGKAHEKNCDGKDPTRRGGRLVRGIPVGELLTAAAKLFCIVIYDFNKKLPVQMARGKHEYCGFRFAILYLYDSKKFQCSPATLLSCSAMTADPGPLY